VSHTSRSGSKLCLTLPLHVHLLSYDMEAQVLGIQSYHPASPKKSKCSDSEAGGEDKAGDEAKARDGAEEEKEENKEENKNERSESPTSPATDESILEGLSDEMQEMLKVVIAQL